MCGRDVIASGCSQRSRLARRAHRCRTGAFQIPTHAPCLPQVAALVRHDHMQASRKTEADTADEWIHEPDAGEIEIGVRAEKTRCV
jgi:hypothetical protein